MAVKSYKDAVGIVNALNLVGALRNFTNPKESKFRYFINWFYDIFLIGTFSCCLFTFNNFGLQARGFDIERIVYTFLLIVYLIGFICLTSLGLHHSQHMLILMKLIDNVDENLKKLGCNIDYRHLYRHVLLIGALWFADTIIMIVIYFAYLEAEGRDIYNIVALTCYMYAARVGSNVLYDFKIPVYWLGLRFKETNELLRKFLVEGQQIKTEDPVENNTVQPSGNLRNESRPLNRWLSEYSIHGSRVLPISNVLKQESQSIKKVHLLQQIRFSHLQLCCASKMVNQIFDAQLLVFTATLLVYITVILYFVYMIYQRYFHLRSNLEIVGAYVLDVVSNCLKVGLVSYGCEYTTNQANKAIEIIHACPVYEIDTDLRDEVRANILQFSLQISHTQLGRSKSAIFRLNYGFIRDCISFVTTYLVIIIQWSQNLSTKEPVVVVNRTNLYDIHANISIQK